MLMDEFYHYRSGVERTVPVSGRSLEKDREKLELPPGEQPR